MRQNTEIEITPFVVLVLHQCQVSNSVDINIPVDVNDSYMQAENVLETLNQSR